RALDRLRDSGVAAMVAGSPPPAPVFDRVERVGRVWVAWLDAKPWAEAPGAQLAWTRLPAGARLLVQATTPSPVLVPDTWDPGWRARCEDRPLAVARAGTAFLGVDVPSGHHEIVLEYDPVEVRLGLAVSAVALAAGILVLTGIRPFWIPGISWAGAWTEPSPR